MNSFAEHNEGGRGDFAHYDEITCLQYLEGFLDRPKALEISAHTAHCPQCRALLGALERETRMLSSALQEQEESVPARLLAWPKKENIQWAWAAVFALAAAGLYWAWNAVIDPWSNSLSRVGFGGTDLMTMAFFRGALWNGWGSVYSMVQALALISLTGIGFFLVRRNMRKWNTVALIVGGIVLALGLPSGASAAEVHHNQANYHLPPDATVNNDLIVTANDARIDGTVDGDVIFAGQHAVINGHVTGDVIVFCSDVQINGTVDGSVRAFGGDVLVRGKIGKNLMAFAQTMDTDAQSQIGWGVTAFAGNVFLNGKIQRDLLLYTTTFSLNGFIGGNVTLKAERSVHVESGAQVQGKFAYKGQNEAQVDSAARLASPIDFTYEKQNVDFYSGITYWHKIEYWGAGFVFGLFILLLMPGFFVETVETSGRFGPAIGIGALSYIAVPILAVLVCFTIVGIPVGIATLLLFLMASYSGKIFTVTWLFRKILPGASAQVAAGQHRWPSLNKGALIGQMALGLLGIDALRMIPYVGIGVTVIFQIWGFGAIALTVYRRIRAANSIAPMSEPAPAVLA